LTITEKKVIRKSTMSVSENLLLRVELRSNNQVTVLTNADKSLQKNLIWYTL